MNQGYGQNTFLQSSTLNSKQIGELSKPKQSGGWTGFFRILIVIVEIGATMIPGVGPELAMGIGLAAAAANTGLSAYESSHGGPAMSGIAVGIDFISAILPMVSATKSASLFNKAINGQRATSETVKGATIEIDSIAAREESQLRNLRRRGAAAQKRMDTARKKMDDFKSLRSELAERQRGVLSNNSKRVVRRMSSGRLNREEEAIKDLEIKLKSFGNSTDEQLQREFEKAAEKHATTVPKIKKQIEELQNVYKEIRQLSFAEKSSRKMFIRKLETLGSEDVINIAKKAYADIFDTTKNIARKNYARILNNARISSLNDMLKAMDLSDKGKESVKSIRNLYKFGKTKLTSEAFDAAWAEYFTPTETGKYLHFSEKDIKTIKAYGIDNFKNDIIFAATGNRDARLVQRVIKYTGSGKFNDKWVQPLQAIFDPNDLGRAPIEYAYKLIKRKFEKKFENKIIKRAEEAGIKNIKKWKNLDEAAIASGAIKIGGRYLFSIKRIKRGARGAALLIFNSDNTGAKSRSGKNMGGKRPVVAYCSGEEFIKLAEEGSSYYWAVGARKGWFISRGGHAASGKGAFHNLSTRLSLFLSFVPIQSLRNVLSIVSNAVGNVHSMAKGTYFSKYWPKLERALVRSTINRSARLVTKVMVGGHYQYRKGLQAIQNVNRESDMTNQMYQAAVAKARSMSATKSIWVGRELQRYSMSILGQFEGADSKGMFAFKSGETKATSRSKYRSAGQNLLRKTLMNSLPTSARGTMLRSTSYYRGRQVDKNTKLITVKGVAGRDRAKDLVTAKRNFQQVGRVYSAFTVPGTPTLRKLTSFR